MAPELVRSSVACRRGALVRAGPLLDSARVGHLPYGSRVHVAPEVRRVPGGSSAVVSRRRVVGRVAGWVSERVLSASPEARAAAAAARRRADRARAAADREYLDRFLASDLARELRRAGGGAPPPRAPAPRPARRAAATMGPPAPRPARRAAATMGPPAPRPARRGAALGPYSVDDVLDARRRLAGGAAPRAARAAPPRAPDPRRQSVDALLDARRAAAAARAGAAAAEARSRAEVVEAIREPPAPGRTTAAAPATPRAPAGAKEAHVLEVIRRAKLESARRTDAARRAADAERRRLGAAAAARAAAPPAPAAPPAARRHPPSPKRVAALRGEPSPGVAETRFVAASPPRWAAVDAALSPPRRVAAVATAARASETKAAPGPPRRASRAARMMDLVNEKLRHDKLAAAAAAAPGRAPRARLAARARA